MPSIEGVPVQATGLLTISLPAVAANWRQLCAMVGPDCAVAAVVKAQAYGLGAVSVTRALLEAGCRSFFLATVDEGIELRQAIGPRADVTLAILSGPPATGTGLLLEHGLTPVLNDLGQIDLWRRKAAGRPAIINIDTGMSRLGLSATDVASLAGDPTALQGVTLLGVMSHLACPDEPSHLLNALQRERFAALAAMLPKAPLSLAASSGIFLGSGYHHQMVRPGMALYGLNPTPERANPMTQVVAVKAKILQVREIDAKATVGYGATHTAQRHSRVAVLGAGYADGYLRAAGNRARVRIGHHSAPVIGRISMDLITVDVTDIPPADLHPEGWATLLGPDYGVDDLARDSGTIGYEILTRLSSRLHRVYIS